MAVKLWKMTLYGSEAVEGELVEAFVAARLATKWL